MAASVKAGKARYDSLCAGCHGTDGVGTEHAPPLADNPDLRGRSIDRIHGTIAAGFPASGMPPFGSLPSEQLDDLADYVRWLNLAASESVGPGDVAEGRRYFWTDGKCGTCHMVHGMGSSIGPDLSDIGARLSAASIHNVLTTPDLNITPGYELATVVATGWQNASRVPAQSDELRHPPAGFEWRLSSVAVERSNVSYQGHTCCDEAVGATAANDAKSDRVSGESHGGGAGCASRAKPNSDTRSKRHRVRWHSSSRVWQLANL